uniref:Succinoglycan biosynthesis protein n=1 Tax=Aggregicoccus edonensis TaxID=1450165 RepID=A0A3Q8I1U7_9BACT|nr:succinoglycan biosynthesis protein [Aggregicoccus edonensis]
MSRSTSVCLLVASLLLACATPPPAVTRPESVADASAPVTAPPPEEVRAWLAKAAVPLKTVEAGHGFEDLRPLAPWLSRARVVALGEATHGTREFFQLKHRMVEYLVTEQGYTVFGLEADFAEALALDDYILTGEGDAARALAGLDLWPWDTEEVLALIHWMRSYNADPKHPRKLRLHGFDMQHTGGAARGLLAYLQKVDAPYAQGVAARLTELTDNTLAHQYARTPERLQPYLAMLAEVRARLDSERRAYERDSSPYEWAIASHERHLLTYLLEATPQLVLTLEEGINVRDAMMADNVRWIQEQEGPGAKLMLWAHNDHVNMRPLEVPGTKPLGQLLRERLGDAVFVFGLAFNQGAFQAIELTPRGKPSRGLIEHTVPPAPEGTLDAVLASAGLPLYALNLRGAPRDGAVGAFLKERRESRQIGSHYRDGMKRVPVRMAELFDGILFVDKTHAAVANSSSKPPPAVKSTP